MKLYTRSGDDGTTGLFGGARVMKNDPRVEAYGNVDELNASIGLVIAACDQTKPLHKRVHELMTTLQSRLFDLGADLATPEQSMHASKIRRLTNVDVSELEKCIDEFDSENEPMKNFILPGGSELAARLHFSRTVCRRAERSIICLTTTESINESNLIFVNRISDMLFAMARRVNQDAGISDIPWQKKK